MRNVRAGMDDQAKLYSFTVNGAFRFTHSRVQQKKQQKN